ncbi:MAG: AEC family transporter [Spirochaetaceae bacterium]|jgi:predicted permease|nr:AEC family transporter [Spirochaetaceae bacterium]
MNVLAFSFNAIAPMLFTTALGWFISRRSKIPQGFTEFLNKLCFRYLLSFHVFNSTMTVDFSAEFNLGLVLFFVIAGLAVIAGAIAVFTLFVQDRGRRCSLIVCSYRSSNIVFALPMAVGLFGAEGIKPAAMLIPVTIIMFNFITVVLMVYYSQGTDGAAPLGATLRKTALDVVQNPLIIGSGIGILLSLLHIRLPAFARGAATMVASAGTPVSFLLLGMQIDFRRLRAAAGPVIGACLMRLVVVPGILVPLMVLAGFRGPELGALMVVYAAPCAVTNYVMSRLYNLDPEFTGQTVTMSTILSMLTMFLEVSLLRALGLF